jgi:uncharacterized protein (DUF2147 family)
MIKQFVIALALLTLAGANVFAADSIIGLWKSVNEKTGMPETVTQIYENGGKNYGRLIASFDENGKLKDTIDKGWEKATKYAGAPSVCGFDLIWALTDKGKAWEGQIFHPTEGNEYVCKIWKDGDKLVVRGQIKFLGIGRNQRWVSVAESELPEGVKPLDPAAIIPVQPKKK